MRTILKPFVQAVAVTALIAFALLQWSTATLGLEAAIGPWATAAVFGVVVLLRTSIPIVVGVYLGATNVFLWHPLAAAALAAPGLLLVAPMITAEILQKIKAGGNTP